MVYLPISLEGWSFTSCGIKTVRFLNHHRITAKQNRIKRGKSTLNSPVTELSSTGYEEGCLWELQVWIEVSVLSSPKQHALGEKPVSSYLKWKEGVNCNKSFPVPGSAPGGGGLWIVRGEKTKAEHSPHPCALGTPAHLAPLPQWSTLQELIKEEFCLIQKVIKKELNRLQAQQMAHDHSPESCC